MIREKIAIIGLSAFFLFGCQNKEENAVELAVPVVSVTGTAMSMIPNKVGIYPVWIYEDLLFFGQVKKECEYALYAIREDTLIEYGEFLRRGEGPYELNIPKLKQYGDTLYMMGIFNGENKIFKVAINEKENICQPQDWEVERWDTYLSLYDIAPLTHGSYYLACGRKNEDNERLFLFIPEKDTLIGLGCPFPDEEKADVIDKALIYKSYIKKHPQRDRFFVCTSDYGRYAFIFDYQNGKLEKVAQPWGVLPAYESKQGKIKLSDDCFLGTRDVAVTEKYIYISFYPYTQKETKERVGNGQNWNDVDKIYVSDWDGDIVKIYQTDVPVRSFVVDKNDRYLYAVGAQEEADRDVIFRFELND